MLMLAYSVALTLGLTLSAPWWLTRMLTTERYREGFRERLGRVPRRLRAAIHGKRVVWLHAVSVGEVLAASRLVEELAASLRASSGEEWTVVVSTTTRTGQSLARERFGPERVFYFPLDLGWAVRAYLRALQPVLLLLVESELWPRTLHECARVRVPVVVVNARVSDRSFRRATRVRRVWTKLLANVTLWLPQSEADAARLIALGVHVERIRTTGNLKYDIRAPRASRLPEWIHEAAGGRPVIVAGSTTGDATSVDEESVVIRAWEAGPRQHHEALLVLAPRHPERFGLIESVVAEFAYAKASDWTAANQGSPPGKQAVPDPPPNEFGLTSNRGPHNHIPGRKGRLDIILLDTIGDLAAVYAVADVAFVGGSLVPRGGHNPLEPAQFGVPVLTGPSFENFRDIVARLRAAGALQVVENEEELEAAMLRLLSDPAAAQSQGDRGRQVFEQEGGATARVVAALLPMLAKGGGTLPVGATTAVQEAER